MNTEQSGHYRRIRSFVRREGRMTESQRQALEAHWPRFGVDPQNGIFDFTALFGRAAPVVLDIGFGNGESLAAMAAADPGTSYLGVEVYRPGVGRLFNRLAQDGIDNVRVVCADAVEVLQRNIADSSLSAVHVFFPDPWPKKRHHKRRLVQPVFVDLVCRKLKPGGRLHVATDWQDYADWVVAVMAGAEGFRNVSGDKLYAERPVYRPLTKYEARGERLGHVVRDLVFEKQY